MSDSRKVDFFIVGAPKCGTTALTEYLDRHPQIFMAKFKESHFFRTAPEKVNEREQRYVKTLSDYHALFDGSTEDQTLGEASVQYLYSEEAVHEIKKYNPSARIIVMLRDPVKMLASYYQDLIYLGLENLPSFKEAWLAEPERRDNESFTVEFGRKQALFYSQTCLYSKYVKRWIDAFGKNQVHVIIFDDFASKTEQAYNELIAFLDLQSYSTSFEPINTRRKVKFRWLSDMLKFPPNSIKKIAKIVLPSQRLRTKIYGKARMFNKAKASKVMLTAEEKSLIINHYSNERKSLEQLLSVDLSSWLKQ